MKIITVVPLSKDKIITRVAGIILMSAFLSVARIYNPFESQLITCQFKDLTGHDCPTCGLSRSVYSLLSLNIIDSISYNPLGILLILGILYFSGKFAAELIVKKEILISMTKPCRKVTIPLIMLTAFSVWILKSVILR